MSHPVQAYTIKGKYTFYWCIDCENFDSLIYWVTELSDHHAQSSNLCSAQNNISNNIVTVIRTRHTVRTAGINAGMKQHQNAAYLSSPHYKIW